MRKWFSGLFLLALTIFAASGLTGCSKKVIRTQPNTVSINGTYENIDAEVSNTTPSADHSADQDFFDEDFDFADFEDDLETENVDVADPIFYWNKGMHHFNDKLYFWALKPAAKGYKWAVPEVARIGIHNFFTNIKFPIRLVGCLLQGKGTAAAAECGKFGINTTVGILGFSNPAKEYPCLNPSEEDVGQAFGKWGIGNGFYIVWPFLGPSTLRDSLGLAGEHFLYPLNYVDPWTYAGGAKVVDIVNTTSLHLGDYEALKDAAIDPYVAIRNAYVQNRQKKIGE